MAETETDCKLGVTEDRWQPQEANREGRPRPRSLRREPGPAHTSTRDFRSPELREDKLLLFKPPCVRKRAASVTGNRHTTRPAWS